MASPTRENVVATQVVTTQMGPDDLLRMVAAGFGLPYQRASKAALLLSIEEYCRACLAEGKRVLLVVDEAQGLPPKAIEELRMLSNFQSGGRSLLQSFLLGQREFRQTMRSKGFEQLRQRVIAAYHLKPLDLPETHEYITHRLTTAGWTGDPEFAPGIFEGVFQFTEGVPRRINTLCDRLLLYGYLEELHELNHQALHAVAHDILEEQGVEVDGRPQLGPTDPSMTGLAPAEPRRSADPVGPSAGETEESMQGRLNAMETSMASLTDAVREELSLLRRALLDASRREEDDDRNGH